MHPSAVNAPPNSIPEPAPLGQLVIDSHEETEVRHPFSMETGRCVCRVRVYTRAEGVIVLFTELSAERRVSDTYAIEQLASQLLPRIISGPSRIDTVTWIAHVPPLDPHNLHREDRFFEVTFASFLDHEKYLSEKMPWGVFSRSSWKRVAIDHVESLTDVRVV